MAAKAMQWPIALPPRKVDFNIDQPSRSGGLSMSGSEQITVSPAGRWRATVSVAVRGEASNLALRAFVGNMEGRAGTVLVPKWEKYRPHDVNGRMFSQSIGSGYSCSDFNFDLSGFAQSDIAYGLSKAAAAAGATRLSIEVLSGEGPRPGHYIGLGWRIYRVQNSWEVDGLLQLQLWPRLRTAVPAGARIILDDPVCLMRFADDAAGDFSLSRAGSGIVSFDFVEVAPDASEVEQVWVGAASEDNRWRGLDFSNPENSQFLSAL